MVEARHCHRKLYLAKGDALDIHVDASLPQHQIEAVRFLYRIFSKKKPGVILNDPSGYGKRVQTVVFLNAIRPLLDRPVLILCQEGKEDVWLNRFSRWSGLRSEIEIELCNPPVLKSFIYINPMCNVGTFSRREWSIVVVDDCTVTRDVLRASLNTHFKIWLTNMDMKKSLQTFSLIFKWLYPKEKFSVEEFQVITKKPSVVHLKSIVLDAFMEDIVLRRKGDFPPFGKHDESIRNPPIVTRKNKDATGKKIKRSKRDSEPTPDPVNNIPTVAAKDILENYINDLQIYKQGIMAVDDVEDDKVVKKRRLNPDDVKDVICEEDNAMKTQESLGLLNDVSSQDIRIKYDSGSDLEPDKPIEDVAKIDSAHNASQFIDTPESDEIDNDENKCDDTPDLDEIDKIVDTKNKNDNSKDKESIDLFSTNEIEAKNEEIDEIEKSIELQNNGVNKNIVESEDIFTNTNENVNNDIDEIPNNTKNVTNGNSDLNVNVSSDNEIGVIIENKTEMGEVEKRMKQLEELTMKKFKGSLLDSIF